MRHDAWRLLGQPGVERWRRIRIRNERERLDAVLGEHYERDDCERDHARAGRSSGRDGRVAIRREYGEEEDDKDSEPSDRAESLEERDVCEQEAERVAGQTQRQFVRGDEPQEVCDLDPQRLPRDQADYRQRYRDQAREQSPLRPAAAGKRIAVENVVGRRDEIARWPCAIERNLRRWPSTHLALGFEVRDRVCP